MRRGLDTCLAYLVSHLNLPEFRMPRHCTLAGRFCGETHRWINRYSAVLTPWHHIHDACTRMRCSNLSRLILAKQQNSYKRNPPTLKKRNKTPPPQKNTSNPLLMLNLVIKCPPHVGDFLFVSSVMKFYGKIVWVSVIRRQCWSWSWISLFVVLV